MIGFGPDAALCAAEDLERFSASSSRSCPATRCSTPPHTTGWPTSSRGAPGRSTAPAGTSITTRPCGARGPRDAGRIGSRQRLGGFHRRRNRVRSARRRRPQRRSPAERRRRMVCAAISRGLEGFVGQPRELGLAPDPLGEHVGQLDELHSISSRRRSAARAGLGARRARRPPRPARRGRAATSLRWRAASSSRSLAGVEARGVERVDDHGSSPRSSRASASRSARVSLTGISSGVDDRDDAGEVAVGDRRRDRRGPGARSVRPGRCRRTSRRTQDPHAVTAGRRVDDDEVVRRGAARSAPLELGELPHLADAEQLAHSRGRHREGVKQPARAERLPERADLDPQVLLHRVLGVDRDREQTGASSIS